MTARILRRKKTYGGWEYEVYCLRCHRAVCSTGRVRNYIWATKPPARNAARQHVDMHIAQDALIAAGSFLPHHEIVEEVNP